MFGFIGAIGAIALIIISVSLPLWVIGTVWDKFWWKRDGSPILSKDEELFKDILVSLGHGETTARRKVLLFRSDQQSPDPARPETGPEHLAEVESALSEPVLGPILRSSPEAFAAWVLARPEHDPIRRDYARRHLGVRHGNP